MKYYLIAGEASGDLHASNLMRQLATLDAEAQFRYVGGDKMQSVGGTLVRHYKDTAYMGFVPVLMHARTILRAMKQCRNDIVGFQPDVLILVDYAGFNLNIARYIHSHTDIPVYYYILPKIWAWKEGRIKQLKRDVDQMFSILPFEVDYYRQKHGVDVNYVGNPCVDAIEQFKQNYTPVVPERPTLAILPGSRRQEIKDNLQIMLRAAAHYPDYKPVVAAVHNIPADYYRRFIPKGMDVELVCDRTYEMLSQSTLAIITSGTASLEGGILRVPHVLCYHTTCGPLVRLLRRLFLRVPFIGLVNLILQSDAVCELVADEMNEKNLCQQLARLLPGSQHRDELSKHYDRLGELLGPAGTSHRAAARMLELLSQTNSKKQKTHV